MHLPADAATGTAGARAALAEWGWTIGLLVLLVGFVSLGSWQVQRRAWKLDLIQRVDQRAHAPAVPAPVHDDAGRIGRDDEYRHVYLDGRFLTERAVTVQAVTVRGPGFWLLMPLQTADGYSVLVNRGFVEVSKPPSLADDSATRVDGLLRLTEPGGGFLRRNEPVAGRWFSRDVAAIAATLGLPPDRVAPYFIDAGAAPYEQPGQPVGGLTVIRFHNSHLVYAITWYALALMCAVGIGIVRQQYRHVRGRDDQR